MSVNIAINRRYTKITHITAGALGLLALSGRAEAQIVPTFAQTSPQTSGQTSPQASAQPPTRVSRIEVVGVTVLDPEAVRAAARDALGDRAPDSTALKAVADAIVALYTRHGYTLARLVGATPEPDGALHLTIAEGRIRQVLVIGNRRTRGATIRRALFVHPDSVYREPDVRADRDRLARLGIFEEVSITARGPGAETDPIPDEPAPGEPEKNPDNKGKKRPVEALPPPPDEIGLVDLLVRVKEGQSGNVAATLGYGDRTGLLGYLSLADNNLFGTAERGVIEWQRYARVFTDEDGLLSSDEPRSAFFVSYGRPALGPAGIAWEARVYNQNTVILPAFGGGFETLRTYERRRGGSARVGRSINRTVSGFLTVRRDTVGYDPVPDRLNPPFGELSRADAIVGAVGAELIADRRDRADNPGNGYLHRVSYENAGHVLGGDRPFSQTVVDLRQYLPLSSRKTGATLAARVLTGLSTGDVPLSEQFFLGGFELLRGYDVYSIRGDRMLLASAEGRLPLSDGLSGVVFVDYGGAFLPGESISPRRLKAGFGVGLRFASPIGPIRFDIAYGSRVQTYLTLGQSF